MVIVHKTELLILSSHFGCSQRNWLRHSADLQLCRMSCRHLWMAQRESNAPGLRSRRKTVLPLSNKERNKHRKHQRPASWPSASSTSASSSCRTTRLYRHGFWCLSPVVNVVLTPSWLNRPFRCFYFFFLCWKGDTLNFKVEHMLVIIYAGLFSWILIHYTFLPLHFTTFNFFP